MAESLYSQLLSERGFQRLEPVTRPEDPVHQDNKPSDGSRLVTLYRSGRPFFQFFETLTMAFDENRDIWVARGNVDLVGIGFERYTDPSEIRLVETNDRLQ